MNQNDAACYSFGSFNKNPLKLHRKRFVQFAYWSCKSIRMPLQRTARSLTFRGRDRSQTYGKLLGQDVTFVVIALNTDLRSTPWPNLLPRNSLALPAAAKSLNLDKQIFKPIDLFRLFQSGSDHCENELRIGGVRAPLDERQCSVQRAWSPIDDRFVAFELW